MNILYLDPIGGIAGDMFLSALLDAAKGEDEKSLINKLSDLKLNGWEWQKEETSRQGFRGLKINFCTKEESVCRHLDDIVSIVKKANFDPDTEEMIFRTFDLVAEAEGKVHGIAKEEVHFHEVGAVDTILDVCAVCYMITRLRINKIVSAPLPMGQGTVTCAHGKIPLPAPAVSELLKGAKVCPSEIRGETVTPTGIALLKALNCEFTDFPAMEVTNIGIGCGTRDSEVPNILRAFFGRTEENNEPDLYRVECTVDDMSGEEFGELWEHVYDSGAKDMYYAPIYMKKGRPALKITVLCDKDHLDDVKKIIFLHTSTLGMICIPVERETLERHFEAVETPLGKVTYKIAEGFGIKKTKAEYEDLHRIAKEHQISLKDVRTQADIAYYHNKENKE